MTRFFAAATLAAAAMVTLTAATQQQQPRFRYLGRAGNVGVVLSTEATGPQTARRMQTVIAARTASLPGGSDNAEVGIIIDCTKNTAALAGLVTYLGTTEKLRMPDATAEATPINPGSNNELLYAFACNGKAYSPAIWIEGSARARAFAMTEARK